MNGSAEREAAAEAEAVLRTLPLDQIPADIEVKTNDVEAGKRLAEYLARVQVELAGAVIRQIDVRQSGDC